jgi:hypothetical protein
MWKQIDTLEEKRTPTQRQSSMKLLSTEKSTSPQHDRKINDSEPPQSRVRGVESFNKNYGGVSAMNLSSLGPTADFFHFVCHNWG